MFLEKFVIDYYTLFSRNEILNEFTNCLFYIPMTNVIMFHRYLGRILDNDEYDEDFKRAFYDSYSKFNDMLDKYSDSVFANEEVEMVYDKEKNVHVCVIPYLEESFGPAVDEAKKTLNYEEADVISTALYRESQIITANDLISDAIKEYKIPIFCMRLK